MVGRENPPWPSPHGGEGKPTLATAAFSGAAPWWGGKPTLAIPHGGEGSYPDEAQSPISVRKRLTSSGPDTTRSQ